MTAAAMAVCIFYFMGTALSQRQNKWKAVLNSDEDGLRFPE